MYVCLCMYVNVIALVQQSECFHHVSYSDQTQVIRLLSKSFTYGAIPLALSNPLSITYVPSPPILGTVSSLNKRNIDSLQKKNLEASKASCLHDVVTSREKACLLPRTFLLYVVMIPVPRIMNKTWQWPCPNSRANRGCLHKRSWSSRAHPAAQPVIPRGRNSLLAPNVPSDSSKQLMCFLHVYSFVIT